VQEVRAVPSLSAETLTLLLLVEVSAVIALLALVLTQRQRLRQLHHTYARLLAGGPSGEDILSAVDRHLAAVERLAGRTEELGRDLAQLRQRVSLMVQAPAVTRYDAFSERGGQLSFSAALVNEAGDGMVLTGINSRMETRTYAKQVEGGESVHNLSDEERLAIARAMGRAAEPVMRSTA
jgi:hypothetical protein